MNGPLVASRLRVLLLCGVRAYRGLFHWLDPRLIVPTMVLAPVLQLACFALIGYYVGSQPLAFYVIGNAVYATARAAVFAATVSIAAERTAGTLSASLSSPTHPFLVFTGRLLPAGLTGFASSALILVLAVGSGLAEVPWAELPPMLVLVAAAGLSCGALGLCLGSVALYLRDVFILPNLAMYLMLLVCGVNLTPDELPGWLRPLADVLPMTQALEGVRAIAQGGPLPVSAIVHEVALTTVYAALAVGLIVVFLRSARRTGALELGT